MAKSEKDIALEIYQSVYESSNKQKKLKSSTFWKSFKVDSRQPAVVQRIRSLLEDQNINIAVKSGEEFGKENSRDWIILTLDNAPSPVAFIDPVSMPPIEWFQEIQARVFESEREVETYFVAPILERLEYKYDDIVIGHPVEMFKGVKRIKTEADFVVFNGPSRNLENALLVIEAKKSDKDITADHIGQAKSYAHELLPACYIVTNGKQIKVYWFNGTLLPDRLVLDIDRSMLREKWKELYGYASKEAAIQRKSRIIGRIRELSEEDSILDSENDSEM